ncbi:MAG: dicarboxylate/amino acid:cation symporter [Gammaproteobacteria bacterium]|nr:dicarboxylate/amino acid:cation symporter [Gammaproteobacteria bacterium]
MFRKWQSITLWKRVLIGLFAGLAIGLTMRYGLGVERATQIADVGFKPFGDAFVRLIKMLIIPLISTTLVVGITAMGDPKKLGTLGTRTIAMYLVTTFFAVSLGLTMGSIIRPGDGINYESAAASAVDSVKGKIETADAAGGIVERLLEIIPTNPVEAWANGAVLPTIFFAILIGVGILVTGRPADPIKNFFEAAAQVIMRVTILVMELAPYGVLALMAWVMATQGIEVVLNMGKLAIALYLSCGIQIGFVYGFLIIVFLLKLPLKQYLRGIADAQGIAFSTASSNATLPVTISCAENNLGVDKSVAGSVLPLGATINMDGTAIYLGLVALFAAQAGGIELTAMHYVMVALTATLVSIGAAGIPSAGLLLAATVLEVIGVNAEQSLLVIAFIFPFDRLLDMMRTLTNISGDVAVACAVAKWDDNLDEDVFRREAEV